MACDRWIDAISAIADGEDPGIDRQLVDAHVARCASCRAFRAELAAMPDVSRRVTAANAAADRASRPRLLRFMLGLVSIQIAAVSLPTLILGDDSDVPHRARDLAAFGVAYAAGLLVVAVRPARARTMLPVAQVLSAAIVVSALIDFVDGSTSIRTEVAHLPELVGALLLWLYLATSAGIDRAASR